MIFEKKADLELLVACGLPLAEEREEGKVAVRPEQLKSELTVLCLELSSRHGCDQRLIDSVQAFIYAIHSHFQKWFKSHLSKVPVVQEWLPKKINGRLIKLSRIAHDRLSKVL